MFFMVACYLQHEYGRLFEMPPPARLLPPPRTSALSSPTRIEAIAVRREAINGVASWPTFSQYIGYDHPPRHTDAGLTVQIASATAITGSALSGHETQLSVLFSRIYAV